MSLTDIRRNSRRHAFALIYQIPFHENYDAETLAEAYTDYLAALEDDDEGVSKELDSAYMIRILSGVLDKLEDIDGVIGKHLKDWRIERISRMDLAVLRLGVYELLYMEDIPAGATINEAVELAKQYGTDESYAFVNGVLGRVSDDA